MGSRVSQSPRGSVLGLCVITRMRFLSHFVLISAVLVLLGCGSNQKAASVVESEKSRWTAEGWSYLETFGRPSDDAVAASHMSSGTARQITAFARTDGAATNRIYAQTQSLYLVVSMQRPTGDAFALVFSKPKP
jgi:hypothetical protein